MLAEYAPWLAAMLVLLGCSAFFSASEAALFYLGWQQRRKLRRGTWRQQLADQLLNDPDRLLSAVLFWNLVANMAYFAIVSVVTLSFESGSERKAVLFSAGALFTMIFVSELLPKSLAVLNAPFVATLVAPPMKLAVRAADPIMPVLQLINLLSRRLLWPNYSREHALSLDDLQRAIELSTTDAKLIEQETAALRNIVLLTDIRVDEWMRPRTQYRTFQFPVSWEDFRGEMTPSGFVLLADPESDEVTAAIRMDELLYIDPAQLASHASDVAVLPWCATVADAFEAMRERDLEVTAVVNEFGETIGILTMDDVLDTVFSYHPSRSRLLLDRKPIHDLGPGKWLVAGVTSQRRFARYLGRELPPSKSVTMAGVVQEELQRLALTGDECDWGPFHLKVLEAPQRGHMLIEVTLREEEESPE